MDNIVEVDTTIFKLLLEIVTATFVFDDDVDVTDQIVVGQFDESDTVNKVVKLYYVVNEDDPLYT